MSLRNVSATPYTYVRRTLKDNYTIEYVKFLNGKIYIENEIKFIGANISIVTDKLENPVVYYYTYYLIPHK